MDTYSLLREFADSWALLAMTVFFLGVIVWAFRPGSTRGYRDTANIPFRHENKPACDDDTNGAHIKEART
ncbi:cbb3-type cytochrome c oxidase subunit 3 [Actibacterium sp. XHP0104]|uniref:cbb3-type cytochrome c oxidase subunit 3 n=1 Tax=Actibacterium sp. XHP0104 TaxID=2984335 RepID=UPI0021E777DF|nr:cbb3-type cytochrome c oxidase subunit 3 [Actibacterium sp. XHP0104]MCV2882818.1 cbb3-type cytochrome c oxidase subunit 3 [Actibacterium sp. XHP0104]